MSRKAKTTDPPETAVIQDWAEDPERPGYIKKVLKYGNCTITVYRPILDPKERAKREAHLKTVAESVLASYYRRIGEW